MNEYEPVAILNRLIDEVAKLCNTVNAENKVLEQKLEEKKETSYFMFCTDLAPYYEIYKKIGEPILVFLDNHFVIQFYSGDVAVSPSERQSDIRYYGVNCYYITQDKDFKAYEELSDLGRKAVNGIVKSWNYKEFEEKFSREVQRVLTEKAKEVTQKNEKLKKEVNV